MALTACAPAIADLLTVTVNWSDFRLTGGDRESGELRLAIYAFQSLEGLEFGSRRARLAQSVSPTAIGVSTSLTQYVEYPGRGYGPGKDWFVQQAKEELAELQWFKRKLGPAFNRLEERQRHEE